MTVSFDFFYQAIRAKQEFIGPHYHPCYEIVYYVNGHGTTRIGQEEYSFSSGDYAIIAPCTVHEERATSQLNVMFTGLISSDSPQLVEGVYRDAPSRPILHLLHKLDFELQNKRSMYKQMLNTIASELFIELFRTHPSEETDDRGDIIRYAQAYMDEYSLQRVDLQSLAAQYGYSYDRFRHLFKEKLGVSPTQYILLRRLERAKTLLHHSPLQVSIIAMECGFSTDAQFCSLFKREIGITPGQYRMLAEPKISNL